MQADAQTAAIYTDLAGLAKLKGAARHGKAEARQETARQFEALFIQTMLKSMRQAMPESSLTGNDQVKLYQDMLDKQLAIDMTRRGGIGIAEFIERQLAPAAQDSAKASNTTPEPLALVTRLWGSRPSATSESGDTGTKTQNTVEKPVGTHWQSPKDFIQALLPAAKHAAQRLKTRPEAVLAVAALETGWGQHVIAQQDGRSSYNLFGIKATGGDTARVSANTLEYKHGAMHRVRQAFRSYTSPSGSVADFADFILQNPRYQAALTHAHDPEAFLAELHKAGYATDPDYTAKVVSVLKQIQTMVQGPVASADTSTQGT